MQTFRHERHGHGTYGGGLHRWITTAWLSFWVTCVALSAERSWSDAVERSLAQAGTNRAELERFLFATPEARREGALFLVEHMPAPDLATLTSAFLVENLNLAYEAFERAPWRETVPRDLFLNDILPYVSVTERRDAWRTQLRELAAPLVQDCRRPGEAARRLNEKLFPLVKVRYSTGRKRADQSPLESMESGIATCTGLSILLVDACRAVGVPARVVGTPLWTNLRGNHTWVEVWDGDWHFVGAAEPDPNGLDRGWFTHDASQAKKDVAQHSIYASSYRSTGVTFPMVWARGVTWVAAVNVTERYTPKVSAPAVDPNTTRLLVKVLDRPAGQRVIADVTLRDPADAQVQLAGKSRDESADLNDILPFAVTKGRTYHLRAEGSGRSVARDYTVGTNAQEVVLLCLDERPAFLSPSMQCYVPATDEGPLRLRDMEKVQVALEDYFRATPEVQARWKAPAGLDRLLRRHEASLRQMAWDVYQKSSSVAVWKADFTNQVVRHEQHLSPYTVKTVGERPTNGWALFIAMHGGGGAPKEVNDSQWQIMQRYYRDHPEVGGYRYVALRAPNDTWNGFYDTYVYPLIANLVRQFLLAGDVDPNKVFLMGYSHGGYGAFAIGPKIPDRFAAIHASAAAPTDGETTARTLRNTLFTYMIGEKDTAYGRIDRCRAFDASVRTLRGSRTNTYPVILQYVPGHGHGGLPDRDKIVEMYAAVRNPVPRDLSWQMTDRVVRDFFWLETSEPEKERFIEATCRDNRLQVHASTNLSRVTVWLDSRLVDWNRPVTIEAGGRSVTRKLEPSLQALCASLQRRGDPELAFTARLALEWGPGGNLQVSDRTSEPSLQRTASVSSKP